MSILHTLSHLSSSDNEEVSGDVGITDDKKIILERVRMNTRKEYLEGTTSGSVRATDRLMRELQDIYRSKSLKEGKSYWIIVGMF